MKSFYQFLLPVVLLFLCTISCNESSKDIENEEEPSVVSTFYFIRHAEKDRTDSSNTDPELNQDGRKCLTLSCWMPFILPTTSVLP